MKRLVLTLETDDFIVTINCVAPPTAVNASNCGPASLTLTVSGGTNGQYKWYAVAS